MATRERRDGARPNADDEGVLVSIEASREASSRTGVRGVDSLAMNAFVAPVL